MSNEVIDNEYTVPMQNFFETTIDEIDKFDEEAWKKGSGYSAPNFPIWSEKIEGLDQGLYMIAGESNHGKSAIALALMWDLCMNEDNNLFGLYFALDDVASDIIPRLVAMTEEIPISVVAKPQRYQDRIEENQSDAMHLSQYLEKRETGLNRLKEKANRFKVVDGTTVQNAEQILDYCKKAQIFVKSLNPDNNIIVCIDSLSDMTFASKNFKSDKELNDHIAKQVKKWAVEELNIPIFGTLHLRKIDQNRRPTVADVKESGRYVYEASALFLVHNDVSRQKQSATIYSTSPDCNEKLPVIELDWAKNKKSSFKGRTYHNFQPNYSKVTECSEESMARFNQLIYSV